MPGISKRKLLKCPAGSLHNHVVYGGFETGRSLLGDVVRYLIQSVADRQLGCDLGDGETVALDANADERETLGFISMTMISSASGEWANWILEPPVSTPMARMISREASRRRWY